MGDIGSESMEQAIAVIHWHLKETRRLFDTGNQTNELSDARTLFEWLKEKGLRQTTARDIQRLSPLRDIERRDNAIAILIEHQMARLTREGSKMTLELNCHFQKCSSLLGQMKPDLCTQLPTVRISVVIFTVCIYTQKWASPSDQDDGFKR